MSSDGASTRHVTVKADRRDARSLAEAKRLAKEEVDRAEQYVVVTLVGGSASVVSGTHDLEGMTQLLAAVKASAVRSAFMQEVPLTPHRILQKLDNTTHTLALKMLGLEG